MREHTEELERLSGIWSERGLPGAKGGRDWNAPPAAGAAAPPQSLTDFREWRAYERQQRALAEGRGLLDAGSEAGSPPQLRIASGTAEEATLVRGGAAAAAEGERGGGAAAGNGPPPASGPPPQQGRVNRRLVGRKKADVVRELASLMEEPV